jgi:hypothetical protein
VSEVVRDQAADTAAEVAELGLHPADEHDAEFPVRGDREDDLAADVDAW